MSDCRSYRQKERDRGTEGWRCVQLNGRRWIDCGDGRTVKTTGATPPEEYDFSVHRAGQPKWWFKVLVAGVWLAAVVKWLLPALMEAL